MASPEQNSPESQHASAAGSSAPPKGPWAIAKALWQQMLDDLPEGRAQFSLTRLLCGSKICANISSS